MYKAFADPQDAFFAAACAGSVSDMQDACAAGADPTKLYRGTSRTQDMFAWELVVNRAPLSTLKACFAFLKDQRVPLVAEFGEMQRSELDHPLFTLMLRKNLLPRERGDVLWYLWFCMSEKDQQRFVHAEDLRTYIFGEEEMALDLSYYTDLLSALWVEPFEKPASFFSHVYKEASPYVTSLFSENAFSDPRITPEAALLLLRSLSVGAGDTTQGWGVLCATAPSCVLRACVSHAPFVEALHEALTSSLNMFVREGITTVPALQETCLLLFKRLQGAGVRWPEHWPEKTQQALCAFPEVCAWLDKRALEKALPSSSSPSSRRARV